MRNGTHIFAIKNDHSNRVLSWIMYGALERSTNDNLLSLVTQYCSNYSSFQKLSISVKDTHSKNSQ